MTDIWEVWAKQYVFFAPREWAPIGPIAVVFEDCPDRKGESQTRRCMKAFSVFLNGERKAATCSDISCIVGFKIGRSFFDTGEDGWIRISKWRFLIWLMGGEWQDCHTDSMLFQLDYLLPYCPPTPEYFLSLWGRMSFYYDGFGVQSGETGSIPVEEYQKIREKAYSFRGTDGGLDWKRHYQRDVALLLAEIELLREAKS